MELIILTAVSALSKIKLTPTARNSLIAQGMGERKAYSGRLKFRDSHKYLSNT